MKRIIIIYFSICFLLGAVMSCSNEDQNLSTSDGVLNQSAIDIAQTSGQLASGTSFVISGSSTDSTSPGINRSQGHRRKGHGKHKGILDGLNLLAPTDELLAIVDAETASDIRGLKISKNGGANITHYNASGETVSLPLGKNGPQGCSFSGKQYPEYDSILATIVKTEIDFGTGVTYRRDTVEITRAGKIVIDRTIDGSTKTEVTSFENYLVNGIKIEGTKTRISNYDSSTGSGSSTTTVTDGKITFVDGTVATWISNKMRVSEVTLDATTGKPTSGTITTEVNTSITAADGSVIYSHKTSAPLIENIRCEGHKRGPVSGVLVTNYRTDNVIVNFGDGTCTNRTITITFNGIVTTKTIGG